MKPLAIILALALGACAQGIEKVSEARLAVDTGIKALEAVDDKALVGLEKAITVLEEEADRVRLLKCRAPYTALVRYARSTPERAAAVLRDCGLDLRAVAE